MLSHERDVKKVKVTHPDAKNAMMKVLIGPDDGWQDNVMRTFEVAADGYTPKHNHDWPHINYILEGEGVLFLDGKENKIEKGSIAYIPAGETHQFKNTSDSKLVLMCIVPRKGHTL